MITGWILYSLNGLLGVLLSPFSSLPNATIPGGLQTALVNVRGLYTSLDPIFPIATLLVVLSIVVSVELAILTYKFTMWLIRKIPGIS